jgi:hypothetical protein
MGLALLENHFSKYPVSRLNSTRPVRVFPVRTFDLVRLINTGKIGRRGRPQKRDGLSFEFADVDECPAVRGALGETNGEYSVG